MNQPAKLLALAGVLAMFAESDREPKTYRSSTSCKDCGKEIPPGKAGRACKECRTPKPDSDVL